jgi:putative hydrolase of the HAD superfamily
MASHLARTDPVFAPPPRALLIDAGFTLVGYDGARIAGIAAGLGLTLEAADIEATEATMRAELAQHDWPQQPGSGAPPSGGARFFRRVLQLARRGAPAAAQVSDGGADLVHIEAVAERIWQQHLVDNLWSRPLPGVVPALESLRAAGLRMAVVSNSEGTLAALLDRMDFTRHFDTVVDSWVLGVTKPSPEIFQAALDRLGARAEEAIMVGDSFKADVLGAQAAGIRAALIDPGDLYRDARVARFPDFATFARSLLEALDRSRRAPVSGS